jgi:hypothetical protein
MPGEIDKVARRREHLLGAPRHLDADVGEGRLSRAAFDQFNIELFFEIANLHGERRLADRTGFRRTAEMPMPGESVEISKLSQGDH